MKRPSARVLGWSYLGRVSYPEGVGLQEEARREVRAGSTPDSLFLLEHPPVYTLGRSAGRRDLLLDGRRLAERGIGVFASDRGGRVTFHGPGQLVGYPVLDLSPDRRDVRRYVRSLQTVLVETLAAFGIEAHGRHEQPQIGVWVGEHKIASIGVHLSRWITTHGFALNVATDLSFFDGIVPCGLPEVRMTSIADLTGRSPGLEEVAVRVVESFERVFGYRARELEPSLVERWRGRARPTETDEPWASAR